MNRSDIIEKNVFRENIEADKKLSNFFESLNQIKNDLELKLNQVDDIDLNLNVITYEIYIKQNNFKININIIRDEKKNLLLTNLTDSEISLQMGGLEEKIIELEAVHEEELFLLNQKKIELQEQYESKIILLDAQYEELKTAWQRLKMELQIQKTNTTLLIAQYLSEKYNPVIEEYELNINNLGDIQSSGWKIINSETKLATLLEERGIKITKSGRILTKTGERFSYEEAVKNKLFEGIDFPIAKIYPYIRRLTLDNELKNSDESNASSNVTTIPKMCSEDVTYLQEHVGTALTLALSEITTVQPRDQIHYLAHWLFKYRYNQKLNIKQKREIDELNTERERIGIERWHKFVEEEARRILYDIITNIQSIEYLETEGEGEYYGGVKLDYQSLFEI